MSSAIDELVTRISKRNLHKNTNNEPYGVPPRPVISKLGSTFYIRPSRKISRLNLQNNIITFFCLA